MKILPTEKELVDPMEDNPNESETNPKGTILNILPNIFA